MRKRSDRCCRTLYLLLGPPVLLLLVCGVANFGTASSAINPYCFSHGAPGPSRVEDLYRQNCARCHGAEGRGDTPMGRVFLAPDFTDPEWWRKSSNFTSNKSLRAIVTNGKSGMPAFGKKLGRTEINQLVSYVRRFRAQQDQPTSRGPAGLWLVQLSTRRASL